MKMKLREREGRGRCCCCCRQCKRRGGILSLNLLFPLLLFVICCFCFLRGKRKGQWSGVIFLRPVGHSWYGPLQIFFEGSCKELKLKRSVGLSAKWPISMRRDGHHAFQIWESVRATPCSYQMCSYCLLQHIFFAKKGKMTWFYSIDRILISYVRIRNVEFLHHGNGNLQRVESHRCTNAQMIMIFEFSACKLQNEPIIHICLNHLFWNLEALLRWLRLSNEASLSSICKQRPYSTIKYPQQFYLQC